MRKLVANFFISLDGVVEKPEQWHFPYFNDEMGAVVARGTDGTDAFLIGRRLYDEWSAYWPARESPPPGEPDAEAAEFHPIAVGRGQRLFARASQPLTLVSVDTFTTGVLNAVYVPA